MEHAPEGEKVGLRYYLKQPIILATAFAFFAYNYVLFFFLSWFPTYLTEAHHMSLHDMSIATVIPWVLGSIGLAAGGFITDMILRITGKPLLARRIVLSVCLGVAALCVGFAGRVDSMEGAVALMSVSIFCLYVTGAVYWAVIQDTVRRENVGGVGGFVHLLANLAGVIGPAVTGFIVQATHGAYGSAFGLAGAGGRCRGAGLVMLAVRDWGAARRQAQGSPRACVVGAFALRGRLDPPPRRGSMVDDKMKYELYLCPLFTLRSGVGHGHEKRLVDAVSTFWVPV